MSNQEMRDRVRDELKDIMANYPSKRPTWQELERLPYLHGIVKEGLRYPLYASIKVVDKVG